MVLFADLHARLRWARYREGLVQIPVLRRVLSIRTPKESVWCFFSVSVPLPGNDLDFLGSFYFLPLFSSFKNGND